MNKKDCPSIEQHILERLKNADDWNDIIMNMCEAGNMDWSEAKAFVQGIEAQKKNQIVLAQSPVLVLVALAIFIGGIALSAWAVGRVVMMYYTFSVSSGSSDLPVHVLYFLIYIIAYAPMFVAFFALGLGMIIGGLKGMQDIWRAFFEMSGLLHAPKE